MFRTGVLYWAGCPLFLCSARSCRPSQVSRNTTDDVTISSGQNAPIPRVRR
ncbi:hypothetical protein SBD_4826 [Streptomyces bottropensis ATCC 25435]|uniref:Uncharacterized protein n=1 Tax=Streptomyces bottropensis ATCC 25435 TaxID=1054862 RepID=M3DAE2_9ACTN|nr:hypothetical protein SBD_4826 [Streptomyces bottropensis ATCC 25435]